MLIERASILSGSVSAMDLPVTQEQLDLYFHGDILLQDAFPQLSLTEREFIKTGITPEEWEQVFGDEEE